MVYYAQKNSENVIIGISELSDEVDDKRYVKIDTPDDSLIGQLYQNGKFIPVKCYAILEENTVTEIISIPENAPMPLSDATMVEVLREESYSLIGTKYVDGKFVQPNPQQDQISALTDKVNSMTQALEDLICMYKNDKQTLYYRLKEKIKKQLKIKEKNGDIHL